MEDDLQAFLKISVGSSTCKKTTKKQKIAHNTHIVHTCNLDKYNKEISINFCTSSIFTFYIFNIIPFSHSTMNHIYSCIFLKFFPTLLYFLGVNRLHLSTHCFPYATRCFPFSTVLILFFH